MASEYSHHTNDVIYGDLWERKALSKRDRSHIFPQGTPSISEFLHRTNFAKMSSARMRSLYCWSSRPQLRALKAVNTNSGF